MLWAYYGIINKWKDFGPQPSGELCEYCDRTKSRGYQDTRAVIIAKCKADSDFQQKFVIERKQVVAEYRGNGGEPLEKKRGIKRQVEVIDEAVHNCLAKGYYHELSSYKKTYGKPKDKGHKVYNVKNPHTLKPTKAVWIPKHATGVWVGARGSQERVVHGSSVADDELMVRSDQLIDAKTFHVDKNFPDLATSDKAGPGALRVLWAKGGGEGGLQHSGP